jgi:hypothetical protein
MSKDGSIWFTGKTGIEHYTKHFLRYPDGTLQEIENKKLGEHEEGKDLIVMRDISVTPDGSKLATLSCNQRTEQCYIAIIQTKTNTLYDVTVPAHAGNISFR